MKAFLQLRWPFREAPVEELAGLGFNLSIQVQNTEVVTDSYSVLTS